MTQMLRPIGSPEPLYQILNHLGFNIVANVARISGIVNLVWVERALGCVCQRHPMLRIGLVETNHQFSFQIHEQPTMHFQVLERQTETHWLEIAEQEIHTTFNPSHSLWRLTLLTSTQSSKSELIFTYHHAIADGISSNLFFHDLLSFYAQIAAGQSISDIITQPVLPAAQELFPGKLKLRYLLKKLHHMLRPPEIIVENSASSEKRYTCLIARSLDRETTQQLKRRCRQAGTTVHGALCAAMLMGVAAVAFPGRSVRLLCDSSVNLRQLSQPSLGYAHIGSLSSIVEIIHTVDRHSAFWDLACECKTEIDQAIGRQEPQSWLCLLQRLGLNEAFVRKLATQKMGRSSAVAVSNLGQYPFSSTYGAIELEAIHFAGGIHGIGACLWLGVATCSPEINFTFAYAYPIISQSLALQLVDSMLGFIKNVCRE
jgi:NRPS condensation-like uncharacterized protein